MMSAADASPGRQALSGSVKVTLAEALILPSALLTTIFLTRRLGPAGFGLYALALAVVIWMELALNSIFHRVAVRLVAESQDWRPAGTTVLRLLLAAGFLSGLLLFALAEPLASLFKEQALALCLKLLSLDLPLSSLALAHRSVLVGRGLYGHRAAVSIFRWSGRFVLIVALVEAGLSLPGAILGHIGASGLEFLAARYFVRPPLFGPTIITIGAFLKQARRLSLAGLGMRLFDRLDLAGLKALGGTAAQTGLYGAAQNLASLPLLLSAGISPVLLSTLTRTLGDGDLEATRRICRNALRTFFWLLPLSALIAGAAEEIVSFLFGTGYGPAATPLRLLIFAGLALYLYWMATAMLAAAGEDRFLLKISGLMLALALPGYIVLIPALGSLGAALVTTGVACFGASLAVWALFRLWKVLPPGGTVWRSLLVSIICLGAAAWWTAPGLQVVFKLLSLTALAALAFAALGEFSRSEMASLRSLLARPQQTAP